MADSGTLSKGGTLAQFFFLINEGKISTSNIFFSQN